MLSRSIDTVTEPKWSHKIRFTEDLEAKLKLVKDNHKDNLLVKYSSLCTEVAPHIEGKKVFLYRNFESHLKKLDTENTKGGQFENMLYEANFWNFRFSNLINAKNVMFIDSDYFLSNQHKVAEQVCGWFEIEYKPLPDIDFHVKHAGYNHNNSPIKI